MHARVCLLVAAVSLGAFGCDSGSAVPAPIEAGLEGTDPNVATYLAEMLDKARQDPQSAVARGNLGMAYEMSGRIQAAYESYAQASQLDPGEPRWIYFEAVTLSELGDLEGALAVLERMLALDDAYAPAHLFRGQWLLDLGRVEEAGQAYTRATQLARNDLAPWIGVAKVHLRSGRPKDAAQILENLLQRAPSHPFLNQLAGQAYREMGDLDRARAVLGLAKPGKQPHWPDPWREERNQFRVGFGAGMMQASDLMKKKRVAEAVVIMERLRAERPGDRQLLNNLSVAYRNLGRQDEAFEVLRDGLERHPEYYPFHLNISADYQRMGDIDRTLAHLDRVVEINPTLALGWERIGSVHFFLGDLEKALEAYEKAARQEPDKQSYQLTCGVILGRLERWEESVRRLELALNSGPNPAAVLIPLGRAQAELGRFGQARASLTRARSLSPDSRYLKEAEERLAELEASRR